MNATWRSSWLFRPCYKSPMPARPLPVVGLILLQAAISSPAAGQSAEEMIERAKSVAPVGRCRHSGSTDELVVCGNRAESDRYRLPLPAERPSISRYDRAGGDMPRASTEAASPLRCGIFEGERRCAKAEAAEFGYGNGRDPLTVAGKLLETLRDPE